MTEPKPADAQAPSEPARDDLLASARRKFGRLAALFGSAAAIATFLLFAGFLSEFALFRFAGLPRLSFNVTALIESGAEVVIDTLSLVVSSWPRGLLLLVGFVFVLAVWSARDSVRWVNRVARWPGALYGARLLALLLAGGLLLSQIGLAQQSLLRSEIDTEKRVITALERAYADGVPTPRREIQALERINYAVPYLPPINWLVDWLEFDADRTDWSDVAQGIPVRTLPESRDAARQVYGWLVLASLVLVGLILVLDRWREWLDDDDALDLGRAAQQAAPDGSPSREGPGGTGLEDAATDRTSAAASTKQPMPEVSAVGAKVTGVPAAASGTPSRAKRRPPPLDEPVRLLIAPLTFVLTVVALALLPISHGILAWPSIGTEMVMVYLDDEAEPVEGCLAVEPADQRKLDQARLSAAEKLRDLLRVRSSRESEYEALLAGYEQAVEDWARLVAESQCADELRHVWESRPPSGLGATSPEIQERFSTAFDYAAERFPQVRFGTILRYPRDKERLELIETIRPRDPVTRGEWAINYYDPTQIDEVVVLPETDLLRVRLVKDLLRSDPDNDDIAELLRKPKPESLDAILDLAQQRTLFVPRARVLVTSIGHMAWAVGPERPDLAERAAKLLIEIASSRETKLWPSKDDEIRGAAASALHLARGVYSASLLAKELDTDLDADAACPPAWQATAARPISGIHCIPEVISAAGFLLQDVLSEQDSLRQAGLQEMPRPLVDTGSALTGFLVRVIADESRQSDHRSAGCSALNVAGQRRLEDADKDRLYGAIERFWTQRDLLGLSTCISAMSTLGLSREQDRALLREVFSTPPDQFVGLNRIQGAAFRNLYEMGLVGEEDFLFQVYRNADDKRAAWVARFLEDATPWVLAERLLSCAGEAVRDEPARAERCLHGLLLLDDDWDGDDGAVEQTSDLVAGKPPEAVRAKACQVLKELEQRGSILANLVMSSPSMTSRCGEADFFEHEIQRERWRHAIGTVPGLPSRDQLPALDALGDEPQEADKEPASMPETRPTDDPAALVGRFINDDGEPALEAAVFLEDVDPDAVAEPLRSCLADAESGPRRLRCLFGVALLAADYRGDDALIAQVAGLADDNEAAIAESACLVLAEYGLRGSAAAERAFDRAGCTTDRAGEPLSLGQRQRWELYAKTVGLIIGLGGAKSGDTGL